MAKCKGQGAKQDVRTGVCRVANNFKTPGTMWAPNLSSFTRPHWYFGAHIFNEMLKAVTKNKNYLRGIPWINFHIILIRTTSFDLGPMKSPTLKNVSSVTNSTPVNPHDLRGRLPIFWSPAWESSPVRETKISLMTKLWIVFLFITITIFLL